MLVLARSYFSEQKRGRQIVTEDREFFHFQLYKMMGQLLTKLAGSGHDWLSVRAVGHACRRLRKFQDSPTMASTCEVLVTGVKSFRYISTWTCLQILLILRPRPAVQAQCAGEPEIAYLPHSAELFSVSGLAPAHAH